MPAQQDEGSVRTSLAGVQGKVLLRGGRGSWRLPLDGAVSTHIVKPPHAEAEHRDLVRTETLAMLARRVGVTTVEVWNESFDEVEASVISRYDRHLDPSGQLVRTHREPARPRAPTGARSTSATADPVCARSPRSCVARGATWRRCCT